MKSKHKMMHNAVKSSFTGRMKNPTLPSPYGEGSGERYYTEN
jgi:hypothetical protein